MGIGLPLNARSWHLILALRVVLPPPVHFQSVRLRLGESRADAMPMLMTDKLHIIVLDVHKNLLTIHQKHGRVQCQLKLRTCADERTADWLSTAFAPSELESYQPR